MLVDTGAIQRNFLKLKTLTKGRCAAVVKGDGYGHGMRPSAAALHQAGADLFFCARFEDAATLREDLGVGPNIAVLDGIPQSLLHDAAKLGISPVINSLPQLEAAHDFANSSGERLRGFVHIDTAMNRLGLSAQDLGRARRLIPGIAIQAYMTHFASADDIDLELCRMQVQRLKDACRHLPPAPLSIANSCATYLGNEFHGDIIRPGKSTFGINPLPEGDSPVEQPATVLATVVQVRTVNKGDPVGYSSSWRAPTARRVALVAIGYANGYLRANSSRGQVAIDGQIADVIGRVSMDLIAIDVNELRPDLVHEGTKVEIVGPTISYRRLAQQAGTNEHEAVIALGRGCRRVYVSQASGGYGRSSACGNGW
ncbi:alanine racemase [Mesorhizobium sp. WSM4887]|uniref:alanine racemase n=1 Tax=Mesorhizobium sp. WSM4887 TaxID=3038543 RepID=UPI00241809EE|nr:alanine racemase [Mesorhizobium sp. WSM4887]MDG4886834.1 alanine racemase [Mesorhizobium sp. WSM4887]